MNDPNQEHVPLTDLPKAILEPYNGIPPDLRHTLTVVVNREEMANMTKLHHKTGLYRYVIAALLHKFAQTLEQHGLTEYDPDRFTQLITECRIVWPNQPGAICGEIHRAVFGSPQPSPVPHPAETNSPHDHRGTGRLPNPSSGESAISTDPKRNNGGKKAGGGSNTNKGKKA